MTMHEQRLKDYVVQVGYWRVRVKAHDAEEAIPLARLQMARELPRLYDVIRELTTARFSVEAAA